VEIAIADRKKCLDNGAHYNEPEGAVDVHRGKKRADGEFKINLMLKEVLSK
jgi:hypothetical protein